MSGRSRSGLQRAGVVLVAWVIGGCAVGPRIVPTEVTTFDAWATLPAERTYVFARTLEYLNSLEVQGYEGLVRDELAAKGFTLASEPDRAQLVVTLRPSVSGTAVRVRDPWPSPYWGYGGGYGGFYGPGRFGYGFGGPFGGFGPGYGFYDDFDTRTVEIFKRRLELDIDSRTIVGKRYYEGRVESNGQDDALPHAVPVLVRALFTDFPGNSGQTRRVNVPVERRPSEEIAR